MKKLAAHLLALAILAIPTSASADAATGFESSARVASGKELPPYLQCVPYARQQTGVQIFGDAHTWWGQAAGKYERGNAPKVGAVMAFEPHGNMLLGHVAAVSKIIDSRTVLLDHANWSPIDGRRGQIERNVKAVDVSPRNDWSQVRVWYAPLAGLGTTAWPVHGFIYGKGAAPRRAQIASAPAARAPAPAPVQQPARRQTSSEFTQAFASLGRSAPARPASPPAAVQRVRAEPVRVAAMPVARPAQRGVDPLEAVVRRYEN